MIEFIFTLDYEIYGNGIGSLKDLVYEPAEKLSAVFRKHKARFVVFVEAAELEIIEAAGTDPAIGMVKDQIRRLHNEGFEIGLHLHPQWYNAKYRNGAWMLDYSEYNLCVLPRHRIEGIVDRSISYLRSILRHSSFTPFSFRAGNWLFQPTQPAAEVLHSRGIKVDSSVFKGGLQHQHGLDYRNTMKNGPYWRFSNNVSVVDFQGSMLELPIYTQMVPFWKMLTGKRIGLQRKAPAAVSNSHNGLKRYLDFLRFRYPLKLDFCRMAKEEMTRMVDSEISADRQTPMALRPLVAIGHTKDTVDLEAVDILLSYLERKKIPVATFDEVYPKVVSG